MTQSTFGIYFAVAVRIRCSLDQLAPRVTEAMGCELVQSTARGIKGDYVGHVLGMGLNLYISLGDQAVNDEGTLYVFNGAPNFEEGTEVSWTTISSYVAQVLREGTGLPWYAPHDHD